MTRLPSSSTRSLQADKARAAGELGAADAVVMNQDAQDLVACPQA